MKSESRDCIGMGMGRGYLFMMVEISQEIAKKTNGKIEKGKKTCRKLIKMIREEFTFNGCASATSNPSGSSLFSIRVLYCD